jgi:hypothetical protein
MELPDNEKLNFIIVVYHSFNEDITGGTLVLHKLGYELARRGHNIFLLSDPEYKHENIQRINSSFSYVNGITNYHWDPIIFPKNKTIVIYPQTTFGNPFNVDHVCRWILYHTQSEVEDSYGLDDVYFNFGNFKTFKNVEDKKLTVFDYNFDKLYITNNNNNRKGFCHLFHKHTPPNGEEIVKQFNSKNLENFKKNKRFNFDYLREELNKHEYFLTYDKKSFFTLAAVLCGCKAIILDINNNSEFYENAFTKSSDYINSLTPTEFRLNNPIQMFGVAYGLEDISWANKTINFATEYLKELENIDNKTIDNFVIYWEKKIFDL